MHKKIKTLKMSSIYCLFEIKFNKKHLFFLLGDFLDIDLQIIAEGFGHILYGILGAGTSGSLQSKYIILHCFTLLYIYIYMYSISAFYLLIFYNILYDHIIIE